MSNVPESLAEAAWRFTDVLEYVNGIHPGSRRNHAKGVGVSGFFESNGNGVRFSEAIVFRPGRVPVIGRFSLGGGQPYIADTPDAVRGLGLQFSLPDSALWRTAMINLPVFVVRTAEAFCEMLIASKPDPATGQPDPAKMKAFLAGHPETVKALASIGKIKPFARAPRRWRLPASRSLQLPPPAMGERRRPPARPQPRTPRRRGCSPAEMDARQLSDLPASHGTYAPAEHTTGR